MARRRPPGHAYKNNVNELSCELSRSGSPGIRRVHWKAMTRTRSGNPETPTARTPLNERTGERYVPMTADRKDALEAEYSRHGRDHLLRF